MSDLTPCPSCKYLNASGAKFCAGCGQSLVQGAAPPPPPPPPPPNYNINLNGGGSGTTRMFDVPLDPQSTITALNRATQADGGGVTDSDGTNGTFIVKRSKMWLTLGMKVPMDGRFNVTPDGNGGSRLTLSVTCSLGNLTNVLAIQIVCGIIMLPFLPIALISCYFIWKGFTTDVPVEVMNALSSRLGAGGAQGGFTAQNQANSGGFSSGPTVSGGSTMQDRIDAMKNMGSKFGLGGQPRAPEPTFPQNQASEPPAKPPAKSTDDPYEQLRRLAGLRDAGAITPEEFEAKKADILSRI